MPVQISDKAAQLLPGNGSALYMRARAKFKIQPWGRGFSHVAEDLTDSELKALKDVVKQVHGDTTGPNKQTLADAAAKLGKAG